MSEYSIALEKQIEMGRHYEASAAKLARLVSLDLHQYGDKETLIRRGVGSALTLNRLLSDAETFYVAEPIQRLLTLAAEAPGLEDFTLRDFTPPSRSGFVLFARPLADDADADGDRYHAMGWTASVRVKKADEAGWRGSVDLVANKIADPFVLRDGRWSLDIPPDAESAIWVSIFAFSITKRAAPDRADLTDYPNQFIDWGTDETLAAVLARPQDDQDADERDPVGVGVRQRIVRLLPTFCGFIQQHVLSAHAERPDRATRRRLGAALPEQAVVNVIKLRRRATAAPADGGGEEVDWQYRWLVRGHWRRQWYPKLERHQMIFITPYVKGPEGRPFKDPRATVFAVVR